MDTDPFNDDNTGRFEGIYHAPAGPVFIHGRTGSRLEDDKLVVTEVDTSTLEVMLGRELRTYDPADVTAIRFRGHEGDDFAQAAGTDDFLFGGAGSDTLRGGPGDDTIDGGPGADALFGEEGFDTIYDGMGDDEVDLGPDGGVILTTPGSDDIFIDGGGSSDTLDFSLDDLEITLDLDSEAIQTVDDDDNTIQLMGVWENFVGSPLADTLTLKPLPGLPRVLTGGDGNDQLLIDAGGNPVINDGTKFRFPGSGLGDITYSGFEDINVFNFPPIIIDNSDAGYSDTGFFDSDPDFPQGFNGGVKFSRADDGNTATWSFTDLAPGSYAVSATWTNAPDRASNSPFTIYDGTSAGTIVDQVNVNQELPPNDFAAAGVSWRNLARVQITGTKLTVELTDVGADEFVTADAIRIAPIHPGTYQLDDGDPGFTGGTGTRVEGVGQFGDQEVFPAGSGDTVATWYFGSVPSPLSFIPGTYLVSTTWGDGALATDAPFTVSNGTDEFTIDVDQSVPPGDFLVDGVAWEELGRIRLDKLEDLEVVLGNGANGSVAADSIRIEPTYELSVFVIDKATGLPVLVLNGGTVDFGKVPRNIVSGEATTTETIVVRNDGIAGVPLTAQILNPASGFTMMPPPVDYLPPGGETEIEFEFTGETVGVAGSPIEVGEGGGAFSGNLAANVINDTTPPTIEIVAPEDGASVIEGSTLRISTMVSDDLIGGSILLQGRSISNEVVDDLFSRRVLLRGDDEAASADVIEFEIEAPLLADPQTPESGEITYTATATDQAGNSTTSSPVTINLVPAEQPEVTVFPLSDGTDPFVDPFFDFHADVVTNREIAQVEFRVNGVVVDTVNQEPYIGHIPRLNSNVSSTITVVALDIFGTEHVSSGLTLRPVDSRPGNIDGDTDFDASDSFLIHLTQLSGTDIQIDQSKGSSPLIAVQIRAIINQLGTFGDVDGDLDFDANDSFLIHLVLLSGTDVQIDQTKGSSLLTAAQIRANVNALGGPPATSSVAVQNFPVVQSVLADAPDGQHASAVGTFPPTGLVPVIKLSERRLFANVRPDQEPLPGIPEELTPAAFVSENVWEDFRDWIDAI